MGPVLWRASGIVAGDHGAIRCRATPTDRGRAALGTSLSLGVGDLGGEQSMVEYWQAKCGGGQRGIIEIVEVTDD